MCGKQIKLVGYRMHFLTVHNYGAGAPADQADAAERRITAVSPPILVALYQVGTFQADGNIMKLVLQNLKIVCFTDDLLVERSEKPKCRFATLGFLWNCSHYSINCLLIKSSKFIYFCVKMKWWERSLFGILKVIG